MGRRLAAALTVLAIILLSVFAYIYYGEASSQLCAECDGRSIPYSSTQTTSIFTNPNNTISVSGLSLCSSNCIYPSPYASGLVTINAAVPLLTLVVFVNNTYDSTPIRPSTTSVTCTTSSGQACSVDIGGSGYSNATFTTITKNYATCSVPQNATSCVATSTGAVSTMTSYAYLFKGSLPNRFVPVLQGLIYEFTFIATFQDGSQATAMAFATVPSSSTNSTGEYNVTFQQVGAGACPFLGEPWAVTIGNTTMVQPAGTALPINDGGPLSATNNTNISNIYFSLPPGSYQYQVHPSSVFFTPSSGTLSVNATSNIVVKIAYTGHGCIATTTTSVASTVTSTRQAVDIVRDSFVQHLALFTSRNVSAIVAQYQPSANVTWNGLTCWSGIYPNSGNSSGDLTKLLSIFFDNTKTLLGYQGFDAVFVGNVTRTSITTMTDGSFIVN
ncbi:MAG: hypothetical protein OK455_06520, partial [Thaumarchaeota archaeon]|nr:hypothetical protein [Nitrososphaerota archaeon]